MNKLKNIFTRTAPALAIIENKILRKVTPVVVYINLTNKCNMACKYCVGKYFDNNKQDLTTQQWKEIINDAINCGTKFFDLMGGEPLLRNDFGELVKYITAKGAMCSIVTNGLLLKYRLKEMKDAFLLLSNICISLDGDKESHISNRGEHSYEKVIEAIKIVKDLKIPVRINTVFTKNNMDQIDFLAELSREIGFFIDVCFLYRSHEQKSENEMELEDGQIKAILKKIIKYKKMGYSFFLSLSTFYYSLNWPYSYSEKKYLLNDEAKLSKKITDCVMGRSVIIIEGDGRIIPCAPRLADDNCPNAVELGFEKAWNRVKDNVANCRTCYHLSYFEYSQLFNLNFSSWVNNIKIQLKDILLKY